MFDSALELLYREWPTPLVKLRSLSSGRVRVWVKLEWYNPFSNSIKDKAAWYMLARALERGVRIRALYEATSSNTGLALAALAAIYGAKARLYISATVQRATDVLLKALGAEVVRVPVELTVEALRRVEGDARRDGAVHLNQFENDATS